MSARDELLTTLLVERYGTAPVRSTARSQPPDAEPVADPLPVVAARRA